MKFHLRRAVAALFVVASGVSTLAHAASVSGQGTWETTLQARDFDGNTATIEAYYDTALNITWLANANYAQTSGYDADGLMNWTTANAWAASLNFNGITGWRLPTTIDTDGPDADSLGNDGCDFGFSGTDCGYSVNTATSEMAHMFYGTLGNETNCTPANADRYSCSDSTPGYSLTNTGPFSIVNYHYWTATTYAPDTNRAWYFSFRDGNQDAATKTMASLLGGWAVHSGDVGAAVVPVPAAAWLFGSGLAGLIGFARRKKRTS